MNYGYYAKKDKKKEILDSVRTVSEEQALEFFCARKNLSLDKFTEIYIVVEL